MITVVSIEKNYASFIAEQKSEGCCLGFCLTWLGDILKERASQPAGGWFSGWFSSVQSQQTKAMLPWDVSRQRVLFERAFRKQKNYARRYQESNANSFNIINPNEVTVNYKNVHQREKEKITGIPGLHYTLRDRNSFMAFKGMNTYGDKNALSGILITFRFTKGEREEAHHAVAAFRYSEFEAFFLDPNFGLFKTITRYPMLEISQYLSGKYKNAQPLSEIIITRHIQTS